MPHQSGAKMVTGMEQDNTAIVPFNAGAPVEVSPAEGYLGRIRPEWQATPLVGRVKRLLPVDPSSACQRLLNAAGHDLRMKIRALGVDLAKDAAKAFGLPPVANDEDLEEYPTARLYDLAYRIGLLSRSEWRRLHRAYEIRRDLEHEDDEYEASLGDLTYVFETAIDIVLSRQPVQVIRLEEVRDVIQSDSPVSVSDDLIEDYRQAPTQRQSEILEALTFWMLDNDRPEIVRANCFRLLRRLGPLAPASARIAVAKKLEIRIGRRPADVETAQVAIASGAFPFIHKRQQRALIDAFLQRFDAVLPGWRRHPDHGELLDDFDAAGGFAICPSGTERRILRWMIEAYVGEPGHYGTFGRNRAVFFSDTGAPRIEKLLREAPPPVAGHMTYVAKEAGIRKLLAIPEQQGRLEYLVSLTASGIQSP